MSINATVEFLTPEQSQHLRSGELGALITVPSEFSDSGQAYVAFVVKGCRRLTTSEVDWAAWSLADFNRDRDHVREYQIAIQKAANAA